MFGLIGSGFDGKHSEETPVYSWTDLGVRYDATGERFDMKSRSVLCPVLDGLPQACGTFFGSLDRAYREVMPQVLLGTDQGDGGTTWIGLQGFSGRLDEVAGSAVLPYGLEPSAIITEVGADATGLLLALQRESVLPSGATLTLGLSLGGYHMTATGLTFMEGSRPADGIQYKSFNGARAQASVGIEYPLSKRLSLGGTMRADL